MWSRLLVSDSPIGIMSGHGMAISREAAKEDEWVESRLNLAAALITLLGLLARIRTASGIFLNPDEALHFRLANQVSLSLAYKASLTAAHPPLLIVLLYYWRAFGTSELWLRLPSVIAGAVFCWMFYKWLTKTAGSLTALIGLLFVAFLPPIIQVAAELRQYSLMLAFLVSALYFLDEAFTENSPSRIAAFTLCLYLAMLFHYSAFWFAAALGIYALFRIFTERPPATLTAAWALSQLGGLALAAFLYKTHLSKLGVGDSRTPLQGWMSEYYLQRSFFDRAHDNPLLFFVGHTFGVFQYFFGLLAVGDVMGVLFVVAVALLLRGQGFGEGQASSRRLGLFLLLPFAIAGIASLAHVYPYGGTRHIAFLIIPANAGVSVALARLASGRWNRGLTFAALIIVICVAFGKPRQPRMNRSDQDRKHMAEAMDFVRKNVEPSALIFTDYQSDLILGHYLCRQQPIAFDPAPAHYEQFSCEGYRVASTDYKTAWMLWGGNFPKEWRRVAQSYSLKPGDTVWIVQMGWGIYLPEDLRKDFAEFRDLPFESFGKNIKIFKLTVGQPMPAATE
jgi:Dolichyl-phosphate-mannose-protein mannosyltransferase